MWRKDIMKKRLSLLVALLGAVVFILTGCGGSNSNNNSAETNKESSSSSKYANEQATDQLISTIKRHPAKFKVALKDGRAELVTTIIDMQSGTYGFTSEKNGIGTYAYANKYKLNDAQEGALQFILRPLNNIGESSINSGNISFDKSNPKYLGINARPEYLKIDSIKKVIHEGKLELKGKVTFHYIDNGGQQKQQTYTSESYVEPSNKPLDKDGIKEALHTDFVNKEIPNSDYAD